MDAGPLSSRELEGARLVASGATNREIAATLTIAPKMASSHIEHILTKLGFSRRAEIAARAAHLPCPAPPSQRPRCHYLFQTRSGGTVFVISMSVARGFGSQGSRFAGSGRAFHSKVTDPWIHECVSGNLVTVDIAVREIRKHTGLSQAARGTAVEVCRQTINAIETGRYDPSLPFAFAVARYFRRTIEDLIHG